ncbi:DUF935 domain-containing protein [uncultured Deefgea sp.]|uniref:DUF935 domain-containing protein n=1 Tax=uncultured Deefgea sp. TaxID=1304914 RepID=UPI00260F9886|nr:DUF935 family protein [uncultured Deefgea sp.]
MSLDQDLKQEIATSDKDPFSVVFNGLMRPNDDTLASRGGGRGLKIYDEIERDCHAFSVLQKRKLALIARPVIVEAASDALLDKKARDIVEQQLNAIGFDGMCLQLMDAVLKGYAAVEIIWEARGAEIWASKAKDKNARRFIFDDQMKPRLLTRENWTTGEALPERKFLIHRYGAKDGNPYGLGLGTRLFWPVFFKRQGIQFWLTFADKFGSPTAVGKYPKGTQPAEQLKLTDALSRISQDAAVTIPEGMTVDLLEAARSGSVNTYESLCRYMDEEISKAVLGETLSTTLGNGGGSLAASRTHNDVRRELTLADADLLSDTLAQLVQWIVEFNVPGATPPRVYRDCSEPEDLNSRSQVDERLGKLGYRPSAELVARVYGEGYEATPVAGSPKLTPPAPHDFAEADPSQFPDQALLDQVLDGIPAKQQTDQMAQLLAPAIKAIQSAKSEDEVLGLLSEAYPQMDANLLEQELGRLMFLADLLGRISAQEQVA